MKLALLIVGTIVVVVVVTVVANVVVYAGTPYQIDRAKGFVDLAAATNNLTEMMVDLNQTLAILEPYHGNPNPLFATSHTDFDLVKQQISATIRAAIEVLPSGPSSFAYQQALRNIQSDLTTTIEGELGDIAGTILFWSVGVWMIALWIIGALVVILGFIFWGD